MKVLPNCLEADLTLGCTEARDPVRADLRGGLGSSGGSASSWCRGILTDSPETHRAWSLLRMGMILVTENGAERMY